MVDFFLQLLSLTLPTSRNCEAKNRQLLTLEQKVKLVKASERGVNSWKLSADFGVKKTQIDHIVPQDNNYVMSMY